MALGLTIAVSGDLAKLFVVFHSVPNAAARCGKDVKGR